MPDEAALEQIRQSTGVNLDWLRTGIGRPFPERVLAKMPGFLWQSEPIVPGGIAAPGPYVISAEDYGCVPKARRRDWIPLVGQRGDCPSPNWKIGQPAPWAEHYVRMPGGVGFGAEVRGRTMEPDYPQGTVLLVGNRVELRPGKTQLALICLASNGDRPLHVIRDATLRGKHVVLSPRNEEFTDEPVSVARVGQVWAVQYAIGRRDPK